MQCRHFDPKLHNVASEDQAKPSFVEGVERSLSSRTVALNHDPAATLYLEMLCSNSCGFYLDTFHSAQMEQLMNLLLFDFQFHSELSSLTLNQQVQTPPIFLEDIHPLSSWLKSVHSLEAKTVAHTVWKEDTLRKIGAITWGWCLHDSQIRVT